MNEHHVLAPMIMDNSLVAIYPLSGAEFEDKTSAAIYQAMADLVAEGRPAGVEGIVSRLQESTGRDYLAEVATIANAYTGAANIHVYVRELRARGTVRRVREIGQKLADITDVAQVDRLVSELLSIGQRQMNYLSDLQKATGDAITLLEELEAGKKPGLPTGIKSLDEKLGGMQPSDLIVIGARSQHGKTALMLQIACRQDVPVGLISGEQPNVQLGMRALAQQGAVSLSNMRIGKLNAAEWERIGHGTQRIASRRVYTMDKGNPSIADIAGQARQWVHHQGIKALFVDYLQLVSGGDGDQHRLQVGDVVYQLKALAKELAIPVIALAQVGRAIDSYPEGDNYRGRMPFANHLADSAKIEDAADQIITLYRPEVYWPLSHLEGVTYLNVCKNRHGPTGAVQARWTGEFVRFSSAA